MILKIRNSFLFVFLLAIISATIFSIYNVSFSQSVEETCKNPENSQQAAWCEELKRLEEEERQLQASLNTQKSKSATIERDVNILTDQIKQAQLNINKKNVSISQIGQDIALKDQTVKQLNEKMDRGKDSLAQLIKKTNEYDNISLAEIVLAEDNLSDFFVNVDEYFIIQESLEKLFDEIREIRGLTEEERIKLEQKKIEEADAKAEIEAQKRVVQTKEAEKKNVLAISKQAEATYEQVLVEKRQRAASIRAALFQLRDAAGISFGDALKYAEAASRATGVRTAFILAILKQESDLGKNVGTCNRAGDPPNKKWNVIMPGPTDGSWRDDQTVFKRITKQLGLDIESTPLSCPIAGGWGGAMGPSQFIPTTWQSYEAKIANALGVSVPNPWNPQHAFTATALYVKDLGAAAGGFTAEKTAALKYYAGSNWGLPQNQFYGNSVMSHAANFQEQIDFLKEVD